MPTTILHGPNKIAYLVYTRAELDALGLQVNPHMYLGGGWRHCVVCEHYVYVYAMSTPGASDCFEVCHDCNNHVSREALWSVEYAQYRKSILDPRD